MAAVEDTEEGGEGSDDGEEARRSSAAALHLCCLPPTLDPPSMSSTAPPSDPPPSHPLSAFNVDQRVQIDSARGAKATIRYIGPLHSQSANITYVGVQWDEDGRGKNDGSLAGQRYFTAPPLSSSFVRHERLLPAVPLLQALRSKYEDHEGGEDTLYLSALNDGVGGGRQRAFDVEIKFVGLQKVSTQIANALPSLRYLSAADMQVSGTGSLTELAQRVRSVTDLDLSNNLIADWREVGNTLTALPRLVCVKLSHNHMLPFASSPSTAAFHSLAASFNQLHTLVLNSVPSAWSTVRMLASQQQLPHLTELHLAHNSLQSLSGGDGGATAAEDMSLWFSSLRSLDLSHNRLEWGEVCCLAHLPQLQQLQVNHNLLTAITYPTTTTAASSTAAAFPALTSLSLSDNSLSSLSSLTALSRFPRLVDLRLQRNAPLDRLAAASSSLASASAPSIVRLHILARLPQLLSLNGAAIPRRERSDADKFYVMWAQAEWRATSDSERGGRQLGEVYERYDELVKKYAFATEEEQKQSMSDAAPPGSARPSTAAAGTLAGNTATLEMRLCDDNPNVSLSVVSKRLLLTMKVSAVPGLLEKQFKVPPAQRSKFKLMVQEAKVRHAAPNRRSVSLFSREHCTVSATCLLMKLGCFRCPAAVLRCDVVGLRVGGAGRRAEAAHALQLGREQRDSHSQACVNTERILRTN